MPYGARASAADWVMLMTAALLVMVAAGDLITLLIAWHLIGVLLYFLLGHDTRSRSAYRYGFWTFITYRFGDLPLLLAAAVLFHTFHTWSLPGVFGALRSTLFWMVLSVAVSANLMPVCWEPVRVLVGDSYPRAVAAMQLYDVLLVNAIVDGMNLVAKEGPVLNSRDGVLILSDRAGARQQLEPGALIVSPCDVYATAEALRQALEMSPEERLESAQRLRWIIEREDIADWLCRQLLAVNELGL